MAAAFQPRQTSDYVTILAICDDTAIPSDSTNSPSRDVRSRGFDQPSSSRPPVASRAKENVVEISSFDSPPPLGLRVSHSPVEMPRSVKTDELDVQNQTPLRSSLRTEKESSAPRTSNRVTLSPEVEKKLIIAESQPRGGLDRGSARKSRISERFFDAHERLIDRSESSSSPPRNFPRSASESGSGRYLKRTPLLQAVENPDHTVLVFPDDDSSGMGIEVTGISVDGRLTSLEIIRIEHDGRVGLDGRLAVGDNIVAIDGRPVCEMTLLRARALISDLSAKPAPTITVSRPTSSFASSRIEPSPSSSSLPPKRPIFSALQQANTQQIGSTSIVNVEKTSSGFGFTVTSRDTARGERLFYIGFVKPNGAAFGKLKAGDRLLQVNDESVAGLLQNDVVERLKATPPGGLVRLEISRITDLSDDTQQENVPPETSQRDVNANSDPMDDLDATLKNGVAEIQNPAPIHKARLAQCADAQELELVVPLNDTGSAGLGVSLKARVSVRADGSRRDCGIFVKKLLVGGAAYKDGRLCVDDQLVAIEDVDLRHFSRNAEASEAVTAKLKQIGPSARIVRLRVLRQLPSTSYSHSSECSRVTVDGPDSTIIVGTGTATTSSGVGSGASSPGKMEHLRFLSTDHDRRISTASTSTRSEGDDDLQPKPDAFDREAPVRKSMSEKRGMGASLDPSNTATFQKIKHQRQTSGSPSRRRSKSVDANLSRTNGGSLVHEEAAGVVPSTSLHAGFDVGGFRNPSYKQVVLGEARVDPKDSEDISAMIAARVNAEKLRDKEKQQRRKSVGSTMKSWFRIGARSRDTSPERTTNGEVERAFERNEAEKKRLQEAYDRLRQRPPSTSYGTPVQSRRDVRREKVFSEYDPTYMQKRCSVSGSSGGGGAPNHSATFDDFRVVTDHYEKHRWTGESTTSDRGHGTRWPPPISPGNPAGATAPRGGAATYGRGSRPPPPPYYAVSSSHSYHGGVGGAGGCSNGGQPAEAWIVRGGNDSLPYNRQHHNVQYPSSQSNYVSVNGSAPIQQRTRPLVAPSTSAPTYYDAFNAWFAYSGGGGLGAKPSVKTAFAGSGRPTAPPQPHPGTRPSEGPEFRTSNGHPTTVPACGHWPRPLVYAQAEPVHVYTGQHQAPHCIGHPATVAYHHATPHATSVYPVDSYGRSAFRPPSAPTHGAYFSHL